MTDLPKTALVTGGAKRLGRAMSLYLAERGFDVAVHYAGSADAAEELVAEVQGMGRRAVALQADLLDEEARHEATARLEAVAGPVRLMSSVSGEGVTETLRALLAEIAEERAARAEPQDGPAWRP